MAERVKIDPNVMITNIRQKEEQKECKCQTCGKVYKKQQTFFSPNKASPLYKNNNGYIPTCKACVDQLFEKYKEFYDGNEDRAIERICQIFDFYYNTSALKASKKISEGRSRISVYMSKIQINPHVGKTYMDTVRETYNEAIGSVDEIQYMDISSMDEKTLEKAVAVWGVGFSPDQYNVLNNMFSDWKSRVIIDGKTREALVRELCIIKLQMNLAIKDNDTKAYTSLMSIYQSTMKSANLQPIQEDANDKASEKPMGVMIKMFEEEDPIPKPLPEWEDVDGIVKYITVYFLGHLCKMLKIKNRYSALYEEEMNKYRVSLPEYEDSDDEDIFEAIINGELDDGEKPSDQA